MLFAAITNKVSIADIYKVVTQNSICKQKVLVAYFYMIFYKGSIMETKLIPGSITRKLMGQILISDSKSPSTTTSSPQANSLQCSGKCGMSTSHCCASKSLCCR